MKRGDDAGAEEMMKREKRRTESKDEDFVFSSSSDLKNYERTEESGHMNKKIEYNHQRLREN